MADYNVTRATRQILKRYRKEQPSLVLHLYPTHFRFQEQVSLFVVVVIVVFLEYYFYYSSMRVFKLQLNIHIFIAW